MRITSGRRTPPLTEADLEALWRPYPEFIGPVEPPMVRWVRDSEKQAAWRKAMNLTEPKVS